MIIEKATLRRIIATVTHIDHDRGFGFAVDDKTGAKIFVGARGCKEFVMIERGTTISCETIPSTKKPKELEARNVEVHRDF